MPSQSDAFQKKAFQPKKAVSSNAFSAMKNSYNLNKLERQWLLVIVSALTLTVLIAVSYTLVFFAVRMSVSNAPDKPPVIKTSK